MAGYYFNNILSHVEKLKAVIGVKVRPPWSISQANRGPNEISQVSALVRTTTRQPVLPYTPLNYVTGNGNVRFTCCRVYSDAYSVLAECGTAAGGKRRARGGGGAAATQSGTAPALSHPPAPIASPPRASYASYSRPS